MQIYNSLEGICTRDKVVMATDGCNMISHHMIIVDAIQTCVLRANKGGGGWEGMREW